MASVEQHGDRWRVIWWDHGKRHRKSFPTEAAAREYADVASPKAGLWRPDPILRELLGSRETPTVAAYGWDLIDDPELKPNTRDMYAAALRRIEREPLGQMKLGKVTAGDVREFFRGVTTNRNNIRSTLAKVFNAALREGVIRVSPLAQANIRPTRRVAGGLRVLTAAEVERLAGAARSSRDRLAIRLGAYVGLRAGEVGGLRLEDVDVEGCRIHVRRNAQRTSEGAAVGTPKTAASVRHLKVPCSLVADIVSYTGDSPPLADGTIFYTAVRNPITDGMLTYAVVQAAAAAGLPRLTFHDLRHTCASLLIAQRFEPKAIQRYLGHSSIRMTFDVYGHLFPNADDPLADGMEELRKAAEL